MKKFSSRLILGIFFGLLLNASYSFSHTCRRDLGGDQPSTERMVPAKIDFDQEVYVTKVRELAKNETFLPVLRYLKERDGGKIKAEHAAAIAATERKLPIEVKKWTSFKALLDHYGRHGREFNVDNYVDYEKAAQRFGNTDSDTALVIHNPIADTWTKFDLSTGDHLVVKANGTIITYLSTSHVEAKKQFIYFLAQFYDKNYVGY